MNKNQFISTGVAGVAPVGSLVLNFDPCQQQGGVSSGDLILEQRGSASEVLALVTQLVLVVIVTVGGAVCGCQAAPVDDDVRAAGDAAGQNAALAENTRHPGDCKKIIQI